MTRITDLSASSRATQLRHLRADVDRIVNGRTARYLTLPFSPGFWALLSYRVDRAGFETFGERWQVVRLALLPLFFFCQVVSNVDIHYRADIGGGLGILHPVLGVVVSGFVVAGEHLTLHGGNCIGGRPEYRYRGAVSIGDWVVLGANATVLSPAALGDRAIVGAGAVVLSAVPGGAIAVGPLARVITSDTSSSGAELGFDAG